MARRDAMLLRRLQAAIAAAAPWPLSRALDFALAFALAYLTL